MLIILTASFVGIRRWYNQRIFWAAITISEGVFHEKWIDDGKPYASVSTNPDTAIGYDSYFFEAKTIGLESIEYYEALMTEVDSYISLTLEIQVPYGEAKQYELLENVQTLSVEKVLENEEYIKEYCTLVSVKYRQ